MTDLHAHILPGMDDGAPDPAVSLDMLRMEAAQGVKTVALTPHFYGDRERPAQFLARRKAAWDRLSDRLRGERGTLPEIVAGAEVAWMPNMSRWDELEALGLGDSRFFLLELPFYPWNNNVIDEIYALLGRSGMTPVLAHLERYLGNQRKEHLRELDAMNIPVQLSAGCLLRFRERSRALRLLRRQDKYVIASDCHDLAGRKPNLGPAAAAARKGLGDAEAARLLRRSERLLFGTEGEKNAAK